MSNHVQDNQIKHTRMKNYRDYQLVLQVSSCSLVTKKRAKSTSRSFTGCYNCKRRKIKCDETRNKCSNCNKKNLDCTWPLHADMKVKKMLLSSERQASIELVCSTLAPAIVSQANDSLLEVVRDIPLVISVPAFLIDFMFFAHFANKFLPTIAQPHFHQRVPTLSLVLSAADNSAMLRDIFVACGASLAAFENHKYRPIAREKYVKALSLFLAEIKRGVVSEGEDLIIVAVQVLQTLCLRDAFQGSNATRCAFHFSAAHKIIIRRLLSASRVSRFSQLERVMVDNYIFNYSLTIFFCEHAQLEKLIPNPFEFFAVSNERLLEMSRDDGSPWTSRMSIIAFQIAAKCSWLCRLKLPLSDADHDVHAELLQFAEAILFMVNSEENRNTSDLNTGSIAKVMLQTSIILLKKMLDMREVRAIHLQRIVQSIIADIRLLCNEGIIFPIWSLMITASTALETEDRHFLKKRLESLLVKSNSTIVKQVCNYLEGLWEIYSADEPFELLFDTTVLDLVCN